MNTATTARPAVEYVGTDKLAVGDVVYCHGGQFRLTARFVSTLPEIAPGSGPCVWFNSEPVDLEGCAIPLSWIDPVTGWNVQGNNFARFARVIA